MAFSTRPDATGRLVPHWNDVAVHDGAAVATVRPGGDAWGTIIEVAHDGTVVADHHVDFVMTTKMNEGPPQPGNVLGLWCNACSVGGAGEVGYGLAVLQAWGVRHGPVYLPVWTSMWSMGARLRDGTGVFITQMWQIGAKARTVVIANQQSKQTVAVLYDEVTDATARPLVAVRLPERTGWVVGAGPNAVVTGWRVLGGSWHSVASKKALLVPTDATGIQLRMVVQGKHQVVTRYSRGS